MKLLGRNRPQAYASWGAAKAAAGRYSDRLVNEFRAARAALNLERGWEPDLTETPLLWLSELGRVQHIVDFGGATGEHLAALGRRRADIRLTVVENPTMCELAPLLGVEYTTEIPASCDIFFTSSALQYLDDPYGVMEAGAKSARKALALSRNSFSETEIFTVQKAPLHANGGGHLPDYPDMPITYPHRTISKSRIKAIAAAAGFRLVAKYPGKDGVPAGHEGESLDLVFLRP